MTAQVIPFPGQVIPMTRKRTAIEQAWADYDKARSMPDGPDRDKAIRDALHRAAKASPSNNLPGGAA